MHLPDANESRPKESAPHMGELGAWRATVRRVAREMLRDEAAGYYQKHMTKFAPLLATAPGRETYTVGVQA